MQNNHFSIKFQTELNLKFMNNFAPLEMSVRQGAKLWNIAPNTIYDRIRKKELQLNENGKITPSEMSRVFGSPRPTKKVQ